MMGTINITNNVSSATILVRLAIKMFASLVSAITTF